MTDDGLTDVLQMKRILLIDLFIVINVLVEKAMPVGGM